MIKKTSFFIALLCLGVVFTGCEKKGGAETPATGGTDGGSSGGSSAAESESIELRVTNTLTASHPMNQALESMAQKVAERTGDRLTIKLFPNSSIGGNTEMVEGVQLGTIDMCNQFAAAFSTYVPEIEVLALAFLFESEEHLYNALDGEAGAILADALRSKGFEPLGYFYGGSRSLINKVKPINSPADLEGLTIRTIGAPITIEGINRMGALATSMGQAEVYSAVEQGVIDGWENSPITLYDQKLYEVTKYMSMTRHFMTPDLFAISSVTWNKLSDEFKTVMIEEAAAAVALERQIWADNVNETIALLEDEGVMFNDVADLDAFREATSSLWDEYEAKYQNGLVEAILNSR